MLKARIEIVLAALLGLATVVTAVWPAWIEGLFGFDPDGGNGTTEWWIVAALAVITIAAAALARRDLRVRAARLGGISGPLVLALAISGVVPARAAAAPGGRAAIKT